MLGFSELTFNVPWKGHMGTISRADPFGSTLQYFTGLSRPILMKKVTPTKLLVGPQADRKIACGIA